MGKGLTAAEFRHAINKVEARFFRLGMKNEFVLVPNPVGNIAIMQTDQDKVKSEFLGYINCENGEVEFLESAWIAEATNTSKDKQEVYARNRRKIREQNELHDYQNG